MTVTVSSCRRLVAFLCGFWGLVIGAAQAQAATTVAPSAFANALGGGGLSTPFRDLARTYQVIISANQFSSLTPNVSLISGIAFRAATNGAGAYPASALSYANFDIYLGKSAAANPAGQSATFASNYAPSGPRTAVRTGALTLPASSFTEPANGVSPFGTTINFTTSYTYLGGDLVLEFRQTGTGDPGSLFFADSAASNGTVTAEIATNPNAYTATVADSPGSDVLITRFTFTTNGGSAAPEPSSLAFAGVGLLGIAAFCRRLRIA